MNIALWCAVFCWHFAWKFVRKLFENEKWLRFWQAISCEEDVQAPLHTAIQTAHPFLVNRAPSHRRAPPLAHLCWCVYWYGCVHVLVVFFPCVAPERASEWMRVRVFKRVAVHLFILCFFFHYLVCLSLRIFGLLRSSALYIFASKENFL